MQPNDNLPYAQVDGEGRLALSPELAARYGLKPGTRISIDERADGLYMRRPARLAKLYIEPTNQCNLDCRTCIRNVWDEPMGKMSAAVFDRIVEGLSAFSPPPTVFFGGFGEPLFHPGITDMIARVKALGAPVEMITNATLLTKDMAKELIKLNLDMLWVSLDGATPESYADIRLGAVLPKVLENLSNFRDMLHIERSLRNYFGQTPKTQIGIEFVAMKRNIADLPAVIRIGRQFGAERVIVTNLLPYTKEMQSEMLYSRTLTDTNSPTVIFPRIDLNETTSKPLNDAMHSKINIIFPGGDADGIKDCCPFIKRGSAAIRWDGGFSPCLPLMHSHTSYMYDRERFVKNWTVGTIAERNLFDLWNAPEHIAFRERVQAFDFSPCKICGGCDMFEKNEEDCYGSIFPTCGGCLWAQGIIQCP